MADMIQSGLLWLAGKLTTYCGQPITYQRGVHTVSLNATIGESDFEMDDGSGALDRYQTRDFEIKASELILNGSVTLPQRGDLIIEGGVTYKVNPPESMEVYQDDGFGQLLTVRSWKRRAG